jgi:putative transposase
MQSSNWKWHLDEVFVKINGERHYLWRAVDHEGEVLESYVTKKRDKKAALKFMKKAMRRYGSPNEIVTDKLGSYGAAARELGCSKKQVTNRWANNRVENSHLPFRRRERSMLRFRRMHSLQKFAWCCQTNENSHRIAGAALIYALNSWRHSVRAAVRLILKLSRE